MMMMMPHSGRGRRGDISIVTFRLDLRQKKGVGTARMCSTSNENMKEIFITLFFIRIKFIRILRLKNRLNLGII